MLVGIIAAVALIAAAIVFSPSARDLFGSDPEAILSEPGMMVVNGTIIGQPHQCAHCHMGYFTPWQETITNQTFEMRPYWNPIYAVQVLSGDEPAVIEESGVQRRQLRQGQSTTYNFQVPENVSAIYARMHGAPSELGFTLGQQMQNQLSNYQIEMVFESPSEQIIVEGPESDLHIAVLLNPEPGAWQLRGTLLDGELPQAQLVFLVEMLGGDVTATLADSSHALRINITDEVRIRARPYTDHQPFEPVDWDALDISPIVRTLWLQNTSYTPPVRAEPARDNANLIGHWSGPATKAYSGEGSQNLGFGTDIPSYFKLAQNPIRNTSLLQAQLTWSPPITMAPELRFSSGESPLYDTAERITNEPGAASFQIPVADNQWDPLGANPCMNRDPECKFYSLWDFAPLLRSESATLFQGDWQLRIVAT